MIISRSNYSWEILELSVARLLLVARLLSVARLASVARLISVATLLKIYCFVWLIVSLYVTDIMTVESVNLFKFWVRIVSPLNELFRIESALSFSVTGRESRKLRFLSRLITVYLYICELF